MNRLLLGAPPLPRTMRYLRKDARGYPVPYIVAWDRQGTPHFPVNDVSKVADVLRRRACAICGRPLEREAWLVGGPKSFLHPRGAFLDPPVHHDCGRYAMQVCPYLAAPSYARRIDDRKVKPGSLENGMQVVHGGGEDGRPPFFLFGSCTAWEPTPQGDAIRAVPPWLTLEVWVQGQKVDDTFGKILIDNAIADIAQEAAS